MAEGIVPVAASAVAVASVEDVPVVVAVPSAVDAKAC